MKMRSFLSFWTDVYFAGTGQHFRIFISVVNQDQWIPQIFILLFILFWLIAFIIGFSRWVLSNEFCSFFDIKFWFLFFVGIYPSNYWDRERFGIPCSSSYAWLFHVRIFNLAIIAFYWCRCCVENFFFKFLIVMLLL
jgi:hypothetical protein